MTPLIDIKQVDKESYKIIKDFLPEKIIDIHTHVYYNSFQKGGIDTQRIVSWPHLVAKENPIEDLMETYGLLFPGKKVTPLIFSSLLNRNDNFEEGNQYIQESASRYQFPSLIFSRPDQNAEIFEQKLINGNFNGAKVYLSLAPDHIPADEITIFNFLPHHQLEVLNRHRSIVMLHIPHRDRLKSLINLQQMIEIEEKYPGIKLIIAHVGRAYCTSDVGNAFEILSSTKNMMFDFSANTNAEVFVQLINTVGPKRILFGSDLPITRMRMKRIVENNKYINIVPKGLYGDVTNDPNMREAGKEEEEKLSFFLYEQIAAFKKAAEITNLTGNDINDVFFNNACKII